MPRRTDHLKDHQWKPGQSGNPNGRPKRKLSDRLERIAECPVPEDLRKWLVKKRLISKNLPTASTFGDIIALVQFIEALGGSTKAFKEITDRIEGKATARIELSGPDGGTIPVDAGSRIDLSKLSSDELRTYVELLSKASRTDN